MPHDILFYYHIRAGTGQNWKVSSGEPVVGDCQTANTPCGNGGGSDKIKSVVDDADVSVHRLIRIDCVVLRSNVDNRLGTLDELVATDHDISYWTGFEPGISIVRNENGRHTGFQKHIVLDQYRLPRTKQEAPA